MLQILQTVLLVVCLFCNCFHSSNQRWTFSQFQFLFLNLWWACLLFIFSFWFAFWVLDCNWQVVVYVDQTALTVSYVLWLPTLTTLIKAFIVGEWLAISTHLRDLSSYRTCTATRTLAFFPNRFETQGLPRKLFPQNIFLFTAFALCKVLFGESS